jgi:hypothetical protein
MSALFKDEFDDERLDERFGRQNAAKKMHGASRHSCTYCPGRSGDERDRLRQLQLLALLEHPDALPPPDALRLARELLTRTDQGPPFRCEVFQEARP